MSDPQVLSKEKYANVLITFLIAQLEVVKNSSTIGLKKYTPTPFQRMTLAICYHILDNPKHLLMIFEHDTLIGWWKDINSKPDKPKVKSKAGRPAIPDDIKDFVFLLKVANMSFGYKRISGELLKMGLKISPSSIRNILKSLPFCPFTHNKPFWDNFLKSKTDDIIACDFIKFYKPVSNQYYFLLFFISHANRKLLHFNTTEHPTKKWIENQLRNINDGSSKKYLVRDNDMLLKYVDFEKFNFEDVPIPFKSPNMNPIAERVIRSFKDETGIEHDELSLDKIHSTFSEFSNYYNNFRPHQGKGNVTIPKHDSKFLPVIIDIKDLFWIGIINKIKQRSFLNGKLKHYYIE
jgi:putative transposase